MLTAVGWAVSCRSGAAKDKNESPSVNKSVRPKMGLTVGLCVFATVVAQPSDALHHNPGRVSSAGPCA